MSTWQEKPIRSLGKVITGKTPPKADSSFFNDGEYCFVSPRDISWGQYYVHQTETRVTEAAIQKFKNQVIPKDAVMFTSLSFGFGKLALASKSCLTNQQINSVVTNEQHDAKFVFYLLQQYRPIIFSYNSGIDTPIVPKSVFESIPVKCPELKGQQKIAAILSSYDDLIENNKRRIALLEKMAEEIYREWFVRFRFPGWQDAEFEKGSPKGWEYRKFRDLVTHYIGGGWGEDEQSAVFSEGAYVVRGTDIPKLTSGDFSPKIFRYHKPSNLKSRRMQEHDFAFEASGGSKDQLLGRNLMLTSGMLSVFGNEVMCASFCKHIRFDKEKVSPLFMKYFLKLFYEQDLVGIYQVQSTGISNYQFESFLDNQHVLVPEESILEHFDALVEPIIAQLDYLALANLQLEQTKSQLLPRLISGKLSVDNLDIQFPPSMQSDQSHNADEAAA
ncbi:restriction endonuclease subunit S [Vreelandella sp. V005]|uniref:restriction endonuclease subunit S n=1 Tax=Vreelandella sp. V005 TaxID=3459608 RepID=UPI0040440CDC